LIFGHKNKPQTGTKIDLGDLQKEKEKLISFLQEHYKMPSTEVQGELIVNSENVPSSDVQHAVTKFIYHMNLNGTHWASLEGTTVKINRFKEEKKKKKAKKEPPHQTAVQSWGL
jgi:hypothetical protein